MRNAVIFKVIPIGLILLAVFTVSLTKVTEVDIWSFLKTGEYILKNRSPPYSDPFSYTLKGQPWRGQAWLSPVIFYIFYKNWGIESLVILKALILTATFVFLLKVFYRRKITVWIGVLILLLVLFVTKARFRERGEIISYFFIALFMYLLESAQYNKNYLLFLPFLMILWSNLHIGCVLGVGLVFAYFIGKIVNYSQSTDTACHVYTRKEFFYFAAIAFTTFVAALINPNVHQVFTISFLIGRDPFLTSYVDELSFPGVLDFKLFWSMIIFCVIGVILSFKHIERYNFFLLAFFMPISIRFQRNIPIFAIIGAPIMAQSWQCILERVIRIVPKFRGWQNLPIFHTQRLNKQILLTSSISLLVVAMLIYTLTKHHKTGILGCGINTRWPGYPKGAIDFIEQNNLQGNVLNWDGFGSYFIFRFWPEREVFVDGRFGQVYPSEFLQNVYLYIWKAGVGWEKMLSSYGIEYILVPMDDQSPLISKMNQSPNWSLVYWDDFAKIYVKNNSKNQAVVEHFTYKVIRPEDTTLSFLDSFDQTTQAIFELKYKLQESPDCGRAHELLGIIYTHMDEFDLAIEEYKKSLEITPRKIYLHYDLGLAYEFKGDYQNALREYQKELKLNPYFTDSYERISLIYQQLGLVDQANKFHKKGLKKTKT